MQSLVSHWKNTGEIHHAILVEGDPTETQSVIATFLETYLTLSLQGNPDLWRFTDSTFGIQDCRALNERAQQKAFGEKKIFIISPSAITREAQNALLKLLEEPPKHTHFFLLLHRRDMLLKTVQSRCFIVSNRGILNESPEPFLPLVIKERLAVVNAIVASKDRFMCDQFLSHLEHEIQSTFKKAHFHKKHTLAWSELKTIMSYKEDRGFSMKLALEHLATTLPVIR